MAKSNRKMRISRPNEEIEKQAPRPNRSTKTKKLGGYFSAPDMPEDPSESTKARSSGRRNKETARVKSIRNKWGSKAA